MCTKFAHTNKQNYFCVDYLRNETTNDHRPPTLNDHNKTEYPPMHNDEFCISQIVIYK